MPTAPVDSKGTELFFTDSGPVKGSTDYTTLVIYHGSAFTGNTFHKLLHLCAKDNVRLVILNRRDYAGSTKYTDEELADLNAGDKAFMERLALEVANFLVWFAETEKVPEVTPDRRRGGFSVMGWSLGNATPLAILGHPEVIPKETLAKLEPYFRQLVLYDPPHLTFGYDQPPEGYNPFIDPDYPTPEAIFNNFRYWVSTYYDHSDPYSVSGLDFSKRGVRPSVDNMTEDETAVNFDPAAAARTEFPMFFPMQPALNAQGQRALFNEELAKTYLPNVEIVFIWCDKANWYCSYGMIETKRQYKQNIAEGKELRPIRFIRINGANHFVHWDDPEAFWTATVEAINN
ncbi:hypothetical protein JAAARDRAFT_183320 [Jaapia argillacea MUCL 33604]|uniref:AB hydrolase-1 domain-containing protein n=1 Tax=Jaapia argillacea MUCL 33604 TaxID=933084 RepID=A0A067PHP2_9AGAM|nr:hypothetical protein JAAARDRAFT_183320 [Jaapia argillacea MUCL 33604]